MKLTVVSLLLVTFNVYVSCKDCPGFNCTYNGMVFCGHIPCPLPPCDQPLVLTPGDCCEHCPSTAHVRQTGSADCPNPCEQGGQHYCHPIPCPLPPCDQPLVLTPGDCCEHCPSTAHIRQTGKNESKDCPYPCTQAGHHYCYPISCAMPPCVDGRIKPGECCPTCPNGPDCAAPDGHVILWKHWEIIGGKNCTCEMPPGDATCV